MKRVDLDELERLMKAATPGPLKRCGCGTCGLIWDGTGDIVIAAGMDARDTNYTAGDGVSNEQRQKNCAALVAAFNAFPDLSAELRELRLLVREKAEHDTKTYAPRQCRCDFCDAARRLGLLEEP